MPQFLIDSKSIHQGCVSLSEAETKHLTKVLRCQKGDTLWVSDGQVRYLASIESIGAKQTKLRLLQKQKQILRAPAPSLGIALLKHDHLESVLQKSVELGVAEIFLFRSERTIPHYAEAVTSKKIARFEKIAREAAKQSGLVATPKIHSLMTFAALAGHFKSFSAVLMAWEQEQECSFHAVFQTIDPTRLLVLIGPEGGFASAEVVLAEQAGAKKMSLGSQILRSETAAITLLALCQYELGNI